MRGVDVLTVHEAGLNGHPDDEQLAYATAQGRTLFSHNIRRFCRPVHRLPGSRTRGKELKSEAVNYGQRFL